MGVSGCGKTTVGQTISSQLEVQFYDGDDYHPTTSKDKMASNVPLTDNDRQPWLETLAQLLSEKECVLACSSLKRVYREMLIKKMANIEEVLFIYLKGSQDVIQNRLTKRQQHYFKAELLQSQFDTLEEPSDQENVITVDCNDNVE